MSAAGLSGFWQLILFFIPFVFVQRWLHFELQRLVYLLTRSRKAVIFVFSILFFPGILLHEASHFLSARLLGVHTGRFSLKPALQADGSLRLGYVEVEKVDFVRNALIGAAPVLTGSLAVLLIGLGTFRGSLLADSIPGSLLMLWESLGRLISSPEMWLSLYLIVSISSMMLPSASDRRDWLSAVLFLGAFLGLVSLAGLWALLAPVLYRWLQQASSAAGMVFGTSLAVHVLFLIPVALMRMLLYRLMKGRLAF